MRLCLLVWWVIILPQRAFSSFLPLPKNIFILAGQSNMAGRGGVVVTSSAAQEIWDGVVPPECSPNPSVLRLDARLAWVEAGEPLHQGIDGAGAGVVGVGPGMAFADTVVGGAPSGFGAVGLVPCAAGGTNITRWEKGGALYRRMVRRARAAAADGGGVVRALLWYQGESDTVVKEDAESYGRRLEKLFLDVRTDLMSPMLPIIQVGLASGEGRYIDRVREGQFGINLLNLRTVDAKGLALKSDNLHLTTESQVRLGKMMAGAFLHFLPTHLSSTSALNTTISTSDSSPAIFSNFIIGFLSTIVMLIMFV